MGHARICKRSAEWLTMPGPALFFWLFQREVKGFWIIHLLVFAGGDLDRLIFNH